MDTAVARQPRSWIRANAPLVASAATFLLVLGMTVSIGSRAVRSIYALQSCPPSFDETVHLLPAIQVANDLRRLDFVAFWKHSSTQDQLAYYPFLYSWLVAPFFLAWPPSLAVGRSTGIIFLGLSILIGFLLAGELSPHPSWRWLAGLTTAGMTMAALPLWAYAGLAYVEAAGLLVSIWALYCYVKSDTNRVTPVWLVACSLSVVGALLVRYSFGVLLAGSLALSEFLGCLFVRRMPLKRWLYLCGPAALLVLYWFSQPGKLSGFWAYSHLQEPNMEEWSIPSLTYYPRILAQLYIPDGLLAALVVAGVVVGLCQIRQHRHRAMLSYLVFGLVVLTVVPLKLPRYACTVASVAFVIAGGGAVAWAATRLAASLRSTVARVCAVLLAVLLLGTQASSALWRLSYLDAAQEAVYSTTPDTSRAYQFIIEHTLAQGVRPFILNSWYAFNQYSLVWQYYSAQGTDARVTTFELAGTGFAPEPTPENLDRLLKSLAEQRVGVLVSVDGSPAGSYTGWQTVEALHVRGDVEPIGSSDPYVFAAWSNDYRDRVLAGDLRDRAELDMVRRSGRREFEVNLHLYRVQ